MLTDEKNVLMLIDLMKKHNVRKVVVSPGTTNVSLVVSLQNDSYFELFSAYDERSAAYMACGMAVESGEAVALSCTQATASRNYLSGLTEAYYRKIPILAITSTQHAGRVGNGFQQAIDRTVQPVDAVKYSVQVPVIHSEEDDWYCNVLINKAMIELFKDGGGPVHINLFTTYSQNYEEKDIISQRVIKSVSYYDLIKGRGPIINNDWKIAIYIGSHKKMSREVIEAINLFCEGHNAVVICDQVSNYTGNYRINPALVLIQKNYETALKRCDLLIHIGDVTGASNGFIAKETWRIDPNGMVMDTFKSQTYIFDMNEVFFFEHYSNNICVEHSYWEDWNSEIGKIERKIPELPFSNIWIAQHTVDFLPENSIVYFGIYNTYRSWNYFSLPDSVVRYANTGGFGIDGGTSSLLGTSLVTEKLCFGFFGDLAFFYDLNALTNRHIGDNIRIIIINNGLGTEFKNPDNRAYRLGEIANPYIAAQGHNGNRSRKLVRHYAEDLGFEYVCAESKEEYLEKMPHFFDQEIHQRMIMEIFVDTQNDTEAYKCMMEIEADRRLTLKNSIVEKLGPKNTENIKKMIGKR